MYVSTYIGLKLAGISKDSADDIEDEYNESSYTDHTEVNDNMPSSIELQHFQLLDKLTDLLCSKSVPLDKTIDILSNLMAHESSKLKVFSPHLIEMFRQCSNISSLLQAVFPYSQFYDYSILEELLQKCCPEGMELLDNEIDSSKCISSYPIPIASSLIIPYSQSYFTLMAIRLNKKCSCLRFKDITKLKSLLLNKFVLSECACTLVAVGLNVSYWRISKSVAEHITGVINKHIDYFDKKRMFDEIAIYQNNPEVIFLVCLQTHAQCIVSYKAICETFYVGKYTNYLHLYDVLDFIASECQFTLINLYQRPYTLYCFDKYIATLHNSQMSALSFDVQYVVLIENTYVCSCIYVKVCARVYR